MTRFITLLVSLNGLGVAIVSDEVHWRVAGAAIALSALISSLWREWDFDRLSAGMFWVALLLARRLRMRQWDFDRLVEHGVEADRSGETVGLEP